MEQHLIVTADGPYYSLFYNLAFAIAFIVLIYEGHKRKFPMLKWVLILLLSKIFIVLGSKIITYTPNDWHFLFENFTFPKATGKSMIGSLIFGTLSLIVGKYLLRFRKNFADAFAYVLPLTLGIMRIGCFLTGCCFGRISELPWAVQYQANTLPHYHQFNDGLLTMNNFLSLPVHPVQLYELTLMGMVVFLLFRLRHFLKKPGSLMILSLILVLTVRFITEFFRDPHAHTIGGEMIWIFSSTQLFIIPVVFALVIMLRFREREIYTISILPSEPEIQQLPAFLILLTLAVIFRALKNFWDYPELISILLVFITAVVIFIFQFFRSYFLSPYRWLYLASLFLPLLLMSQTYPDSFNQQTAFKKYKTVKIGFATGHFQNSHNIGTGEGCDRVGHTEYFDQKYFLAGGGFETTKTYPFKNEQYSYGIKGYLGNHNEIRLSDNFNKTNFLFALTPYAVYETNWLGIGAGLHIGNISIITENLKEEGSTFPKSGSKETFLYPQFYLRGGPRDYIFLEYRFSDYFPSALPGFRHQIGIGTGFGDADNYSLIIGIIPESNVYVRGKFLAGGKYVIEPIVVIGNPKWDSGTRQITQFSLGMSYRFGFKEGNDKP